MDQIPEQAKWPGSHGVEGEGRDHTGFERTVPSSGGGERWGIEGSAWLKRPIGNSWVL